MIDADMMKRSPELQDANGGFWNSIIYKIEKRP